jgi:hypothetical protein
MPPTHFDPPQPFIRVGGRTLDNTPRSRGAMRPSCAGTLSLQTQRAQETPGARCTRSRAWSVVNTRVSHHRFTGPPAFPAQWFYGLFRALPGDRAFLPPSSPRSLLPGNLTPASGRQDHTTSPSARSAPSSTRRLTSTASLPYVRDDRETPLCAGRDGERCAGDLRQK